MKKFNIKEFKVILKDCTEIQDKVNRGKEEMVTAKRKRANEKIIDIDVKTVKDTKQRKEKSY